MEYQLLGNHPSIQKIRELIRVVSDTALSVLILGETGTGKEVVARLLHGASSRRENPFVKVNCAALPHALLESELFGYEKGAFTGAERRKPGKFELASDGVIFLDEIGDMPMVLQAKLLQVLQSGEFTRLGGTQDVRVNTWVISSTNQDLSRNIKKGLFREDLYYRLNIIRVELPPLRERKEDIPLLADYFLEKYRKELGFGGISGIDSKMMDLFLRYSWPGNVRELSSTILKLVIGDDPKTISEGLERNIIGEVGAGGGDSSAQPAEALVPGDESEKGPLALKEVKRKATEYIERKAILHALRMTGWNKTEAAKILKISYKALWYKVINLGIEKPQGS